MKKESNLNPEWFNWSGTLLVDGEAVGEVDNLVSMFKNFSLRFWRAENILGPQT
jgi:hypothetical protein